MPLELRNLLPTGPYHSMKVYTPSVLSIIGESANCAMASRRRISLSNPQGRILWIQLVFISAAGRLTAAAIGTFLAFPLLYFMIDAAIRRASRNRTPLYPNEPTSPYRRYP